MGGTRRRGKVQQTVAKDYGLLRHVVARTPSAIVWLGVALVHGLQAVAHLSLMAALVAEAVSQPGAEARVLGVVAWDTGLGLAQAVWSMLDLLRVLGLEEHTAVSLRRVSMLQSILATALHIACPPRPPEGGYRAPPLFGLMAYFVAPWSGLCAWLVALRPQDYQRGCGVLLEALLLAAVFGARAVLFGPLLPRVSARLPWLWDAMALGLLAAVLDACVLRAPWLEELGNWQYVLCVANLAWPWPLLPGILEHFRHPFGHHAARVRSASRTRRRPSAQLSASQ